MAAAFGKKILEIEIQGTDGRTVAAHQPVEIAADRSRIAHEIDLLRITGTVEARAKFDRRLDDNPLVLPIANDLPRAEELDESHQRTIAGNKRRIVIRRFKLDKGFDRL